MDTETQPKSNLLRRPVNRMLLLMAAPISLGMLSTFLFQLVDTFFVGRLGSQELAALAFASTTFFLIVGLFIGMSVGVSAVVARAIGANDTRAAGQLALLALVLTLVVGGILGVAGYFTITPVFSILGAEPQILEFIREYMDIVYLSLPLLTTAIVGSGIIRANGIINRSEVVFALAGVVNLVGDYLLIFGIGPFPELGLRGAAWASVASFAFAFVGVAALLVYNRLLGVPAIAWVAIRRAYAEIFRLAVPSVGMQILLPVIGIFITFLLARVSSEAVAAFGIASRIEALALVGIFGVSSAITPFIAQNFGAAEHDRIDKAIVFGGKTSIYMGILLFVLLLIFGAPIARLFSSDPMVVQLVSLYFGLVSISYAIFGIFNVTIAIFTGLQLPLQALRIMAFKTLVLTVPLALIGSFFEVRGIFIAIAVSNIGSGVMAAIMMRRSMRKWNRPPAEANIIKEYVADFKRIIRVLRFR